MPSLDSSGKASRPSQRLRRQFLSHLQAMPTLLAVLAWAMLVVDEWDPSMGPPHGTPRHGTPLQARLRSVPWAMLVVDEAHKLKNQAGKARAVVDRWAVLDLT